MDRRAVSGAIGDGSRRIVALVAEESTRQNLIAAKSLDEIWVRHVVDSAQLVALRARSGVWVDVGTGGRVSRLIVAALIDDPVVMVEPRARRATFLQEVVAALELDAASVVQGKAGTVESGAVATVSARAVASIGALFAMCHGFSDASTRFLLPRGRSGDAELAEAQQTWQGTFHVKHSITAPESIIVIADTVRVR